MSVQDIVLVILIVAFAIQTYTTSRMLYRHQKALEWFANHIHLDFKAIPPDAPPELLDLVTGKEEKNTETKP